jgi:hypothetical protein
VLLLAWRRRAGTVVVVKKIVSTTRSHTGAASRKLAGPREGEQGRGPAGGIESAGPLERGARGAWGI